MKNPVARNQLTLTPGNSPEGSMMGPEENHTSKKQTSKSQKLTSQWLQEPIQLRIVPLKCCLGKRDFDVIEINDSSDENSPQKRARIQIRNSNDHHAHANFHSATDQPVIATRIGSQTWSLNFKLILNISIWYEINL